MPPAQPRYEALDAWRGFSACLVALFHLDAYSHFYDLAILRHSYLFVDFFFVLSGFVITANYRSRLASGFSLGHFMFLRLGRLYPLHLSVLVALISVELLRYQFSGVFGGAASTKFTGATSIEAIVTNLLLIQSLGMHSMLTWNFPSWSISTEFYTYFVFAIAVIVLQSRSYLFAAAIVGVMPIVLFYFVGQIDTEYTFGIVRCLLGFFVGFICYDLHLVAGGAIKIGPGNYGMMSLIEAIIVACIIVFVCAFGNGLASLAAPFLFGLAVIIFSLEGGAVSKTLRLHPFLFLGTLSYSIYMVHWPIELGIQYALQFAAKAWGVHVYNGGQIGANMWEGDISYVVTLILVIGISCFTYWYIEEPGRQCARILSAKVFFAKETENNLISSERLHKILAKGDDSVSQGTSNHVMVP